VITRGWSAGGCPDKEGNDEETEQQTDQQTFTLESERHGESSFCDDCGGGVGVSVERSKAESGGKDVGSTVAGTSTATVATHARIPW
jgi:hypothetical protein